MSHRPHAVFTEGALETLPTPARCALSAVLMAAGLEQASSFGGYGATGGRWHWQGGVSCDSGNTGLTEPGRAPQLRTYSPARSTDREASAGYSRRAAGAAGGHQSRGEGQRTPGRGAVVFPEVVRTAEPSDGNREDTRWRRGHPCARTAARTGVPRSRSRPALRQCPMSSSRVGGGAGGPWAPEGRT